MKRVGIITILNVNNYGAELQAFALQHYINQLGFNTEIINYLYYKNPKFKRTKGSAPFIGLTRRQKFKEFLFPYIATLKSLPYYGAKRNRDEKFESFHSKYTKVSIPYNSIEKLYSANLRYDFYISGSDQIWNPHTNTNLKPYFLDFAPKDKTKIAYASSFGVDKIPYEYEDIYKKYLSNFDEIRVREKSGTSIVNNLLNKKINWVVDPTFLLAKKDWQKFEVTPDYGKPYLLLYVLTDSEYITGIGKRIAAKLGLKIVRLCKNASKEDSGDEILNIIDAGPEEFLGWFSKASFVLTTSFHGVCFSLNFQKSFFSILKLKKSNNSRQIDLLTELGLEKRVKYENDEVDFDHLLIDYTEVSPRLKNKVKESKNYLKEVLQHPNES